MKSILQIITEETQNLLGVTKDVKFNQNFWNWFGNSKVVDEQGQPLKVYHGTQEDFSEFIGDNGLIYFSKTPRYANEFATNPNVRKGSIIPVYLKIQNPLDLTKFKINPVSKQEFADELNNSGIEINQRILKSGWYSDFDTNDTKIWQWIRFNSKYLLPIFKSKGFDGIFMYEDANTGRKNISDIAYVIFNNTQVKSATGNNGEFNVNNPDITKESKITNKSNFNSKLYYHGRNPGNRPYTGQYIFITDNLGYAAGYSDGKKLLTYTIPFEENQIFSIKNNRHLQQLSKVLDKQTINAIIRDSGQNQEIDWAALSYIGTDEYEMPEDLLQHLGFKAVRLKERQGIDSIYVFNEADLNFIGEIDITTPENIEKIGQFYKDFSKDKNFLQEQTIHLLHEEIIYNLESYLNENIQMPSEGVADRYAEKEFNIPDSNKAMDQRAMQGILDKPYAIIKKYNGIKVSEVPIYKNPQSLVGFDADVRAIALSNGDLYIMQINADVMHGGMGRAIGLTDTYDSIDNVLLHRAGITNKFGFGDSATGYVQDNAKNWKNTVKILRLTKSKNPQFDYYPIFFQFIKNLKLKPIDASGEDNYDEPIDINDYDLTNENKNIEENSQYNKSKFTDLPQELFNKLRMRKFSDAANRSHMKLYKAKDGKYYIISKGINQDIFKATTIDGKNVGVAVFDDDNKDYFSGYESQQSIRVEPEYQRIGIATALTDFAETIYNKPYKPSKLLSEPMQGFVKNRFK